MIVIAINAAIKVGMMEVWVEQVADSQMMINAEATITIMKTTGAMMMATIIVGTIMPAITQ